MALLGSRLCFCVLAASFVLGAALNGPCQPYDAFDNPFPWRIDTPLVVAQDGTGNCSSIQAGIDLLYPKFAYRQRSFIHVKPGIYREKLRVPPLTPPLTLQGLGGGPEYVTVVWDDSEYDPDGPPGCRGNEGREWDSQTLQVAADDFTVSDMTIWNSACGNTQGRNFAVSVTADRAAFWRMQVWGTQDTFYTGFKRVYVRDSFINGTGDFLFGIGTAVFENCEVQEAQSGGFLTAHRGNSVSEADGASAMCDLGYGRSCNAYVFIGSRLTRAAKASGNPGGTTYLGRPWHGDYATVVFLNTWMGPHIASRGWSPWSTGCKSDDLQCNDVFYAEFNSSGPGSNPAGRVKWSRQLMVEEAQSYNAYRVLRGWAPVDPLVDSPWLVVV